jgi:hypothetical protein
MGRGSWWFFMLVWCAEIGKDGSGDSDLGFSKWAEKLRGGASGLVQFPNLLMLDRNCLFICASLVGNIDALSSGSGYSERSIRFTSVRRFRMWKYIILFQNLLGFDWECLSGFVKSYNLVGFLIQLSPLQGHHYKVCICLQGRIGSRILFSCQRVVLL